MYFLPKARHTFVRLGYQIALQHYAWGPLETTDHQQKAQKCEQTVNKQQKGLLFTV